MPTTDDLRSQGNIAYKAGKLEEAIDFYNQASTSDPEDARPISNLSAAFYELGDYTSAIEASDRALCLASDSKSKQKLLLRKLKSQLHALDFRNGQATAQLIEESSEGNRLRRCIDVYLGSRLPGHDARAIHSKILADLPRLKPQIRTAPEYFVFGHDCPESLYESDLAKAGRDKIALMFGGIGDGRHMLASLVTIFVGEAVEKADDKQQFHFTIVDHKPAVIARNLVMLVMLDALAKTKGANEAAATRISTALSYTFLAPIIPPDVHTILQSIIQRLIDMLEHRLAWPSNLDVSETFRPNILRILREWQHEVGDQFPPSKLRPQIQRARVVADMQDFMAAQAYMGSNTPHSRAPPGSEKQEAFYKETAILTKTSNGRGQGKEVQEAFDAFHASGGKHVKPEFLSWVEANWKTNPTMIDLDYERSREYDDNDQSLCHDPFGFAADLVAVGMAVETKSGLMSYMRLYYWSAAEGIRHLGPRLKIEACVGDVNSILEQIRYGAVGHRHQASSPADMAVSQTDNVDPKAQQSPPRNQEIFSDDYPKLYDRIHISNIPDYTGGSLSTFLYAVPMVQHDAPCYATSNCLRNPPRFAAHKHYFNEYLGGLSSDADLKKTFQVRPAIYDEQLENPLILTEYMRYHHEPTTLTSASRLPRGRLEKWLHQLFLKLAIPKDRAPSGEILLYSPLNLTAFLRVCGHLHNVGYPAHWMSEILSEICSGAITTKARPPRSEPLSLNEAKADMPALRQTTAPFVAEMTTLLSLWQFALPFGVLLPELPSLDMIHKYKVTFEDVDDSFAEPAHFILILFDTQHLPPGLKTIRPYLLSDELGDKSHKADSVRSSIHVLTTWEWEQYSKTAEFWLRRDLMETLKATQRWAVQIWRVDAWTYQSMPQPLVDCQDMGQFWDPRAKN